ncbi:MAG: nucleotidyltransferase family protein [Candidatus Omnitrophota bacterium]|nr:nucleotidyltransferase family protein [Candidatus Omnitrophota bacterium]MDD5517905.1 nucleotidyltransferase family protein [Candidatus Omnitrophota bacterium]
MLAAGYATRLYPLTREYPKPLLEVKRRPILDYIINKLEKVRAVDEIIVVTNSKFMAKFREWKKPLKVKKPVVLVDDLTRSNTDRLGAIGDMAFVIRKKRIQEDILVIGGDNLFSGGLTKFVNFAVSKSPAATIGLYRLGNLKDASSYGVAKLDGSKRVVYFEEKPAKPKSRLVAMCLYYIPAARLRLIEEYLKIAKKADATGNYIDWLKSRMDTYGFIFQGSWYDIGDFKYLTRAKKYFA